MAVRDDGFCAICGVDLTTGLPGEIQPLLPGDLPTDDQLCDNCAPRAATDPSPGRATPTP